MSVSSIYALLIGVDCYMPNILPDGSRYQNLGGSVRDIDQVEAYLKDVQNVPAEQILKLSASPSAGDEQQPIEPPGKLATRNNIIDNFRKLGEMAAAGSQVYIHYSGHGGRAKTVFESIKGVNEIDEGLVPTDIGTSAGQYLRDIELAHLLQELVKKELVVTVVLDCCHSGGATRGDAEIRGNESTGDKPLQADYRAVATIAELEDTWKLLTGAGTRGLKAGGLPVSNEYVVLAACRQNEYAYEYAFNRETRERSGALTYWLLDTLRQANPGRTYKDLYDRINAQIHSQFPSQTPLLLGAGDRLVFGSDRGETVFAIPVMQVEPNEAGKLQAVIGVGQANGVTKGSEFAIYPGGTTDLTKIEHRVAIAKIIQRGSTDSLCNLEAVDDKELKVEPGYLAVQISLAKSLIKKVSLFMQEAATPEELAQADLPANKLRPELFAKQSGAFEAIRTAIVAGKGWVELDENIAQEDNGDLVSFIVAVNNQGEYEICPGGSFEPFENINPPLSVDDAESPGKLVQRLLHLAKYQVSKSIVNDDSGSPLAGKLAVEWLGTSDTFDVGDPIPTGSALQKFADPSQPTVKVGDYIFLAIRNDFNEALNVAVLNFEADWSIAQILPNLQKTQEQFVTIEKGKTEIIPLQPSIEGTGDKIENTLKVFATRDQANFRWLELPSLDLPILFKASRSGARSLEPLNPLDALLAAINDEKPQTRKLTVAASPNQEWTTKQLVLTICK
jgi:Caspase domain